MSSVHEWRRVGSGRTLGELLSPDFNVTLDTNVLDFLLASGLSCQGIRAYENAPRRVQAEAKRRYHARRARTDKTGEVKRLASELETAYYQQEILKLHDVTEYLAEGQAWGTVSDRSLAYLGRMLFEEYGVGPFPLHQTKHDPSAIRK